MARPSQQQPTQTAVVLSQCLHVSYAAAFLCAARERWRSRRANLLWWPEFDAGARAPASHAPQAAPSGAGECASAAMIPRTG